MLDCAQFKDERTALGDAISTMMACAGGHEPSAFSMQQLSRNEQWRLLTGGSHTSIRDERLQRRVTARILSSVGEWSLERQKVLEAVAEAIRAAGHPLLQLRPRGDQSAPAAQLLVGTQ